MTPAASGGVAEDDRGRMDDRKMQKPEIGQRFRKMSLPSVVWEVVGHLVDRCGIPHVRLVSIGPHSRTMLIAESVIGRSDMFTQEPLQP
jgi:hypothetical protein